MNEFQHEESDENRAARELYEDAINEGKGIAADEIARLQAELAAARAERDDNERGWQRTYDHDVALLKARAEKAEAEAARLRAAITSAPHDKHCVYLEITPADDCNCWKRAALQEGGR